MNRPTIWTSPRWRFWKRTCWNFAGALVLVTHDRYLLDRVSTVVLGLDGKGGAERFADYSQWNAWKNRRGQKKNSELYPRWRRRWNCGQKSPDNPIQPGQEKTFIHGSTRILIH